jgi:hypothetical protein
MNSFLKAFGMVPDNTASLEDIPHAHKEEIQASLSAYFNFHGIDCRKEIPANLAIPWASNDKDKDETHQAYGFLVATGKLSRERKWPVFNVIGYYGLSQHRSETLMALMP